MSEFNDLENDLWLGIRPVDDPLFFLFNHHVVMVDGVIFHLQTTNGDKNGGEIQIVVE
jgi:hypothetical protein